MHVATYGVRTGNLLHGEDGLHMIVVLFTVDADYLALVECEGERFMTVAFELGRIGLFGKSGVGMQRLFTAYRCTPNTLVYRIFGFFEVEIDTVTADIFYLLLTAEMTIAYEGYNLYLGSYGTEYHIETHLIVTRAGRAVTKVIGPYLLGITSYARRLRDTFCAHGQGVSTVLEHVAVDHIADSIVIECLRQIEFFEALDTECQRPFLNGGDLLFAETAGVAYNGVHLEIHLLTEPYGAIRRIEAAAEC